ncbi:hypothetical protein OE88DRAFT_1245566 [Heliocybe sulcata]|uniref:Uncharacterized protein n=1 Tax=Heliocybe sulcata TaxID=5364 RepID=A0A5C3N7V3_9AGAM|nr:hypothetical protein OE88DRAFT_1245566 [Heliocybe sulcata]
MSLPLNIEVQAPRTKPDPLGGWFDYDVACAQDGEHDLEGAFYADPATWNPCSDPAVSSRRRSSILFDIQDGCVPAAEASSTSEDVSMPLNFPIHRPNIYHSISADHRVSPFSSYTPSPEAMEATLSSLNSPLLLDDDLEISSSATHSDLEDVIEYHSTINYDEDYGVAAFLQDCSDMEADSLASLSPITPLPSYESPVRPLCCTQPSYGVSPVGSESRLSPMPVSHPCPPSTSLRSSFADVLSCPSPFTFTVVAPPSPPPLSPTPSYAPLRSPCDGPPSPHSPGISREASPLSALSSLASSPLSSPMLPVTGLPSDLFSHGPDSQSSIPGFVRHQTDFCSYADEGHSASRTQPLRRSKRGVSGGQQSQKVPVRFMAEEACPSSPSPMPLSSEPDEEEDASSSDAYGTDYEESSDDDYVGSRAKAKTTKFGRGRSTLSLPPASRGSRRKAGSKAAYHCYVCDVNITRAYDLKRHNASEGHIRNAVAAGISVKSNKLSCEYCGKELSRGDALKRHWDNPRVCLTSSQVLAQAMVSQEEKKDAKERANTKPRMKRKEMEEEEGGRSSKRLKRK